MSLCADKTDHQSNMQDLPKPHADGASTTASPRYFQRVLKSLTPLCFFFFVKLLLPSCFFITWAHMATGVLVSGGRLTESWGTHFSVAQDATLPAGAACALVQVPGLPLHIKFPARCSANHLWLPTARFIYRRKIQKQRKQGGLQNVAVLNEISRFSQRNWS